MNSYRNFLACFLLGLIWSCESKKQTESHHHPHAASTVQTALAGSVAQLEKEVLAVHDSLMDRVGEFMQLQEDIASKVQKNSGVVKERGLQISRQLKESDEAMTDWMHHYKGDTLKQLDEKNGVAYLKSQQAKVNKLNQQMRKSMTVAEKYLKE